MCEFVSLCSEFSLDNKQRASSLLTNFCLFLATDFPKRDNFLENNATVMVGVLNRNFHKNCKLSSFLSEMIFDAGISFSDSELVMFQTSRVKETLNSQILKSSLS